MSEDNKDKTMDIAMDMDSVNSDVSEKSSKESSKELREKLVKQIDHTKDIDFSDFSSSSKKQSKKQNKLTGMICILLIAGLGYAVYLGFFTRNDIMRKNKIGDSYSSIVNHERFMYDSKDGESFTDTWLIYKDVKFMDYKGDVFYYFNEPNGKLLGVSMKMNYSDGCYKDVLKYMNKQYGDYKTEKYNSVIPEAFRWDKDGQIIRLLSSKDTNVIEVNIFSENDA